VITRQSIDFNCILFFYYGSQWLTSTVWLPSFFKMSFFVCSGQEINSYRFGKILIVQFKFYLLQNIEYMTV